MTGPLATGRAVRRNVAIVSKEESILILLSFDDDGSGVRLVTISAKIIFRLNKRKIHVGKSIGLFMRPIEAAACNQERGGEVEFISPDAVVGSVGLPVKIPLYAKR